MKVLMAVALAGLGWAYLVGQGTSEPVPSKWLHDGKLAAEDFDFSIDSPTPDSHWSRISLPNIQGGKATALIVDFPTDQRFMILVWGRRSSGQQLDSSNTKEFIDGMQKSMPKDWHVGAARLEPSDFPLKNSSKITIPIQLPNSAMLYAYGYAVTGPRTYMLLHYSQETTEPAQFTHFVGSFALMQGKGVSGPMAYVILGVMFLVIQVIPIWIAAKAKPLANKPYHWGTYIAIITGVIGLSFCMLTFSEPSDVYGRWTGTVVGGCAILCALGLLLRQRFGIIMFVLTYFLLMLATPFLVAVRNEPVSSIKQGSLLPLLIFWIVTTGYFVKRWSLMGRKKQNYRAP